MAQLDRVPGYEPGGREFESLRARHMEQRLSIKSVLSLFRFRPKPENYPHFYPHSQEPLLAVSQSEIVSRWSGRPFCETDSQLDIQIVEQTTEPPLHQLEPCRHPGYRGADERIMMGL